MAESSLPRPPGRPRSARADRAILDAALTLFVEHGFDGMSMEGVAARAGVGKATVYRRWDTKEALVVAAVGELIEDVEPTDTGTVRGDLLAMLVRLHAMMTSRSLGEVFPRMVPHLATNSPLGAAYVAGVLRPRFELLESAVRRGIDRGELPPGTDPALVREMLTGPLILAALLPTPMAVSRAGAVERLVDTVLGGLQGQGAT